MTEPLEPSPKPSRAPGTIRPVWVAVSLAWGLVATLLALRSGWSRETAYMAGIFLTAALLWVSEAVPLFATGFLILGAEILLLANPAGWPGLGPASGDGPTVAALLAAAADPLLLLFLGGLMLAQSASEEGVDRVLSGWLLRPFGRSPRGVLLGLLVTTAVLSMWMSNTATAALMLALVAPVAARCPDRDPFRKALYLAIPVGANLGGIGTPVASPPNAIAANLLQQAGVGIPFLTWMQVTLPCLAVMLLAAWWALSSWYPCTVPVLPPGSPPPRLSRRARGVVAVFIGAILLWLTDRWHGLPASIVGLLVVLALTLTGLFTPASLKRLDWGVLILIAGGLALGNGMQVSRLDERIVAWLPDPAAGGGLGFLAALLGVTAVLGTFMSSTAAANILLPLTLTALSPSGEATPAAASAAVGVTVLLAAAMFLPSSTPPNAIAHSSRMFATADLARIAAVLTTLAVCLVLFAIPVLSAWAGIGAGP